jgi:hypothetical protein
MPTIMLVPQTERFCLHIELICRAMMRLRIIEKITVVNVLGMCITLHVLNFFQPFHSNIYIIITKIPVITND